MLLNPLFCLNKFIDLGWSELVYPSRISHLYEVWQKYFIQPCLVQTENVNFASSSLSTAALFRLHSNTSPE